jgi:hypothetical protein
MKEATYNRGTGYTAWLYATNLRNEFTQRIYATKLRTGAHQATSAGLDGTGQESRLVCVRPFLVWCMVHGA